MNFMGNVFKKIQEGKVYFIVGIGMLLGFVFLLNALLTIQLKFDNRELSNTILELENEVKALHQENQKSTTDEFIETQATEHLGMVKSNETPVKIKEIEPEINIQDLSVDSNQKISIYFKDWYLQLEEWMEMAKK
jgi:cell division protein FtsB